MSFFQTVSNWLSGDYKVRGTQVSDNSIIQHVRVDIGTGTSEATLDSTGLPVSGEVVADAGTGWASATLVGDSLTGKEGLPIQVNNGGVAAWEVQPLTDTQLRASAVPISAASLPLPSGAATSANQTNGTQKAIIVDSTGAEMDLFKQGDNFAAGGDHGLMVLAVDSGTPQKYHPLQVDASEADGESNTKTRLSTESTLHTYNGSTWDRVRGDTTSGMWVNIKNSSLAVTGTFWQTTQPVSQLPLPAATNATAQLSLASAATAYQPTAPASPYLLVLSNNSDTDMKWGYATATATGILLPKSGGTVAMIMAASKAPYINCASAGKVCDYTTTVL